jgi:integrase
LPKITNSRYLQFKNPNKDFDEYTQEEFEEKLATIKYPNPDKTQQARILSIALYYTGLRPIEVISLQPDAINKTGQDITIFLKAAKNGLEGQIILPSTKLTREFYAYAKKCVPGTNIFYYFMSKSRNKPKYKKFHKVLKDDQIVTIAEEVQGDYPNPAHNLNYFINKWFGVPPYYFRHNRFTKMKKLGASNDDIRMAKLGRTEYSTLAYVKYDSVEAGKRKKYYPKD